MRSHFAYQSINYNWSFSYRKISKPKRIPKNPRYFHFQVAKDFDKIASMQKVEDRLIRVQFMADKGASMQWDFKPLQSEVNFTSLFKNFNFRFLIKFNFSYDTFYFNFNYLTSSFIIEFNLTSSSKL